MHVIQHVPCPALAPYVASYWEIKHDLPLDVTIAVPFGCTGHSHFVFCLESPFQCYSQAQQQLEVCESTVFGLFGIPMTKYFNGPTLGIVVDFTPTGLQALWQLPVQELSEQSVDLTAMITSGIRALTDQMREARTTPQRFALLEGFLLRRLARANRIKQWQTDGRIEAAVALMQHQPGQISLNQLAYTLNSSERTFRRRFTQVVGVSPKYFLRMQRFMHTRRWLKQQSRPNWQDLVTLNGYYDQAHLINEFNYFTGTSPRLYEQVSAGLHDILYG
ncbi:helix-turn-helix domain-containing protein [Spirosoma utsteinense]|uniref:AraC-like DNA-binding protein n=1 Tax=Spirosoma utsteinense TaxID=2585773 RepID=A0ABR6W6M0_9BACT|nr:helix-turn-helix domain-containing protein [Spirosoma utsteinense]MBC3785652.1 AraC-like DNA-binding protein [Spirosoma utsteinense]MBC3791803.1 AraC-like DNA-binding protein [Spirosoma utsteinense]